MEEYGESLCKEFDYEILPEVGPVYPTPTNIGNSYKTIEMYIEEHKCEEYKSLIQFLENWGILK